MKKETLDKANKLEDQIGQYKLLAYFMAYPYQKYRLFKNKPKVSNAGYSSSSSEVTISDKELAQLIENYCRAKIKTLQKELEEL
jgi:hypothetical protein